MNEGQRAEVWRLHLGYAHWPMCRIHLAVENVQQRTFSHSCFQSMTRSLTLAHLSDYSSHRPLHGRPSLKWALDLSSVQRSRRT